MRGLVYVGREPVFVSPESGTPVAFAAVGASGRRFPAFDQLGAMAHVLRTTGVAAEVAALVGLGPEVDVRGVAADLVRLLNGQWWYVHNTADHPTATATKAMDVVRRALRAHATPADALADATGSGPVSAVLSREDAYAGGGPALRLGAQLPLAD